MVSSYFKIKTALKDFDDRVNTFLSELKDKKVVVYGCGDGFYALDKKYNFSEKLNLIAIADMKFQDDNTTFYKNIKQISPKQISNEHFDFILVTNEASCKIFQFLKHDLNISEESVKLLFEENITDESININYLESFKFSKSIVKLQKKLKNKKVIIYGAGLFLQVIQKYYDISKLNVIAISDKRFETYNQGETFLNYPVCSPDEIKNLKPDYVLVATKYYVNIVEDLYYNLLKDAKIKIKPLLKKDILTLIKEIWK